MITDHAAWNSQVADLRRMSNTLRRWIVERSQAANVGHIGSALSIADIMAVLWGGVLQNPGTDLPDRDRFVLSKGHAALALYCVLRWHNLMDESTFQSYCGDGSLLGGHPEISLPGVDVATGSLGQGLSIGTGLAHGLALKKSAARVYVLMSDAELNEGQIWEAVMYAGHHKLNNLTVAVDLNGMQALGNTEEVINLGSVSQKFKAFGWDAVDVDGHNHQALWDAFRPAAGPTGPRAVIAHTLLGKGFSFMEDRLEWHYRPLTPDLYSTALTELEQLA